MKFIKDFKWDFSCFKFVFDELSKYVFCDTKILVAVSGGPDSMFVSLLMYEFFKQKWFDLWNLYFIHCNHKTRVQTDQEELFVKDFFRWLNLLISVYSWNGHTEDELRKWRYSMFNHEIQDYWIKYLITWHNLTDRIESTFMNLSRWSWINWFMSMRFLDFNNLLESAQILRPILSFTKKQIEDFCKKFEIPYVIDQTNLDKNTSLRNNLRLEIFPQLANISNKNDEKTCSFFDSMKQIYSDIEKLEKPDNIWEFYPIKKSGYWNADFAYQREIPFWFIDEKTLLIVLKKFNIYSDVSKWTLFDFLQFFKEAKQWYKYINGVYFFISNWKIYIIKSKQKFWEKCIEKQQIINKIWIVEIWKETVEIENSDFIWCVIRYPKIWDKVWTKTWWEWCINKKIPIFWRNFIPVVELKNWLVECSLKNIL